MRKYAINNIINMTDINEDESASKSIASIRRKAKKLSRRAERRDAKAEIDARRAEIEDSRELRPFWAEDAAIETIERPVLVNNPFGGMEVFA